MSSLPETAANADLASARARRDEAWRALRLLAADPAAGPGGREPLLLEHEARERALDATVDAVLSHADAVARVSVLRRTVETRQQSALSAKEGVLTKALAVQSGRDAWIVLWQPSGLEPPAVEQASFTRDHERFVKDLDKWLQDRVQHQVDEGGFEEARARLRDGLGGLGVDCAEAAPLAALNLLLDDRVSAGEKHNAAREASLAAAEKAHADATRHLLKAASATATTAQARAELSRVTSALELPAATREDESKLRLWVAEGKTLADQLRGLCDLRESLEAEDAAYARRREQLRGVLQGLHERGFALDDGAGSPLEQIQLLGALLQEARETKAREDAHAVALGAVSSRARAEEEWSSAWTRHLEAASLPAWDVDEEAVRALLNRIAAVQAAEADLAKQRTQIEIAAQLSLGELEARVAGRCSSDLDHERVRLAAAVVALQTERNACHAATLDATRALAALDAMGDHDTLLQEREAALTLLVDELAETITVKGASLLLTELQEELAHTDQRTALLDRASAYLRRLTAGAIGAVRADDDEASLSVVRAGDDEALPVEALSDGTRDQVLLALRLAVAQRQLADKRLPFVLDDVLVHFDDARALAALQAFAELAEHTQVILFTHHRHLLDLGRAASVRFHAVELAPPVSSITELDVADGAAIDSPRPLPKAPKKPRASAPDPLARELLSLAPDGAEGLFLEKLGELGGKSGNVALRRALAWEEAVYDGVKARLVAAKQLGLGKGKGGSVRLAGVGPEEGDT